MTDYALVGTNIIFNSAPVLNASIVLQVLTSNLLTATLSHIVGTEVVNGLSFIPGISAEGSMLGTPQADPGIIAGDFLSDLLFFF